MTKPPSSPVRKRPTALRAVLLVVTASLLAGCSIESHDSRLDHCLKAHDVDHGSSGVTTVCDEYDLPWKDGH